MRGEQLDVDVGLAARETLEEAGGAQLDQIAEAGVAGGQQGEVVPLVAGLLRRLDPVVDQIGLETDDRLYPGGLARLVVLDRPVHHAVIGEPERRHVELGRTSRQLVDLAGPVEQRILAVDMQMNRSGAHPSIMPGQADRVDTNNAPNKHHSRTCRMKFRPLVSYAWTGVKNPPTPPRSQVAR